MATVLIVPRDTAVGDLIGEFVAAAGHDVVYSTDDESVTQRLQRTGATIALVDIEHMDVEEVTVAQQLRSVGVPVIAFSGRLIDEELEAIAGSSASATFALPATARMLAQQLQALEYVGVPEGTRPDPAHGPYSPAPHRN
jgi:DNA-binding response OmpR family regulator